MADKQLDQPIPYIITPLALALLEGSEVEKDISAKELFRRSCVVLETLKDEAQDKPRST